MKKKLQSMASQLSERDIQELLRIKRLGGKRAVALQKKRDKLATELARIERELEELTGETLPPLKRTRGRKPGRPKATGRSPRRNNLSAAVREVFKKSGKPLKASDVVDGLPEFGVKVKDVADMRKRISVVLASQKAYFKPVERGVYKLISK